MKVTRKDTKVTEEPTKREESPVISDILLQLGVRKAEEKDWRTAAVRRNATSSRSIKASASAENFYMNGFHYVADLLRASSRGALISSSQRVLLSSATIQAAVRWWSTGIHTHIHTKARHYFNISELRTEIYKTPEILLIHTIRCS